MTTTVVIDSFERFWGPPRVRLAHVAFSLYTARALVCVLQPPYEVCREYLTYSMRGIRQLKSAIKTYEVQMSEGEGDGGSDDDEDQFNWLHPDYVALHTSLEHERQHQRNITPYLRYEGGAFAPVDPDSVICLF